MRRTVFALVCLSFVTVSPLLAQTQPHPLEPVRVTVGSRLSTQLPVATRAVEVLGAEDLERQPVRTVQEALALALGVDLMPRSPVQADVAIRGGTFEQVLVLVDGVRVSDAQTGHFHLSLAIPLEDVERIEILRGPASALYGADAFGGVINIVTRSHESAGVNGRIEGGSHGTLGASAGARGSSEKLRAGATVEYRRSDGHRPGTDYRIASGRATAEALVAGRPLRAALAIADRDFGAANFYTSPEAEFDEFEATRALTALLSWDAPAAARFTLEPRLALRRHDDDFVLLRSEPSFYRNVHTTWQTGGELIARYVPEQGHLAAGGELYRDRLKSTNLGNRTEDRGALFAEAGFGRAGQALVSIGVRADWHSAYGTFVAPSLGGAFLIGEHRVRASLSRAFRAPSWTDRYYEDPANIGDPELRPERAWEAEIGAELAAGPANLSLGAFVRRAESLIDWARPAGSPPTAPWQTMNIGRTTFQGFEIGVRGVELFGTRIAGLASGIRFDTDDVGGYESKYALRPLARQFSLDLDRAFIAGARLALRAAHARRAGEDGHLRVDARLSAMMPIGRVFLDVTNLADARYLDVSGMRAPGTTVHAGLDWTWRR